MPSFLIIAHRIVWSAVLLVGGLGIVRGWGWLREVWATPRRFWLLGLSSLLIALNWSLYIWAVNAGHVVETSLGYFINPLLSVVLGVVVLRERLGRLQWLAVALAALGVAWLAWASPRFPWVALVLAASFGIYSLVKKRTHLAPTEGMLLETALIAVPALAVLAWLGAQGELAFGHGARGTDLLLISTGLMTTVPLVAFAYAAQRLDLATLGMLQYLSPTLQFLLGVFVLHEPMDARRLAGFAAVWAGLAVFSAGKWARGRAVASAAPSA